MSRDSRQALRVASLLQQHGQPVTLPSGETVGIADLEGQPARTPWPTAGQGWRPNAEQQPSVALADADAAGLALHDPVIINGVTYSVSALPRADGSGLTPVELMPPRSGETPTESRWK